MVVVYVSEPRPGRIFWRFLNSDGFILMDIRGAEGPETEGEGIAGPA